MIGKDLIRSLRSFRSRPCAKINIGPQWVAWTTSAAIAIWCGLVAHGFMHKQPNGCQAGSQGTVRADTRRSTGCVLAPAKRSLNDVGLNTRAVELTDVHAQKNSAAARHPWLRC